jgi:hypothetical protein
VAVLALKLILAPAFVVGASLTARRFGPRIGGLVGGLPVVAGPILLVLAIVHDRRPPPRPVRVELWVIWTLCSTRCSDLDGWSRRRPGTCPCAPPAPRRWSSRSPPASAGLGPRLSGLLAPSPIITTVLAAFTHAQLGTDATLRLLRGMLTGFFAFALFCWTVALALPDSSIVVAFALAAAVAALTQAVILGGEVVGSRP